jgi:hypothetical protein
METKPELENDNGCGQGYHPSHLSHPYHRIALTFGYTYSHSTRYGYPTLSSESGYLWGLLHCYKHGEHNLSFSTLELDPFEHSHSAQTSVSCASGRKHVCPSGRMLRYHLEYKANRYKLAKLKSVVEPEFIY